jgi:3-deoxy-7-phosphoheptulonate synthase
MPAVFEDVIHQLENGDEAIRGLMLESHIFAGSQPMIYDISKLDPRISITDPCIGWEKTEELINWAHQRLMHMNHITH